METLRDAGVGQADAVITTADTDSTNVMVCLLAKRQGITAVVSVVHDPDHMALFEEIGVNTMQNPQRFIAEYFFRAVMCSSIVDYMPVGDDAEVLEIRVDEDAPLTGKTIRDAGPTSPRSRRISITGRTSLRLSTTPARRWMRRRSSS
ncbi:potassium channel family protein [Halorussus salinisoli]|uniref:potassium channel family protein n=1 Tax=Halorussus salinisoli TaxID=2558242 RepID=UPI0010C1FD22|nr:TrkA family potassium uptake protein [Halorussus salinisoli]